MRDDEKRATRKVLAVLRSRRAESRRRRNASDVYSVAFAVLIVGAALVSAVANAGASLDCVVWGCAESSPLVLGLLPAWVAIGGFAAGVLVGPLFASPAELAVLYRAPLSRHLLLRATRMRLLTVAACGGATVGLGAALWSGQSALLAVPCLAGAVAGVLLGERRQLLGWGMSVDRVSWVAGAFGAVSAVVSSKWMVGGPEGLVVGATLSALLVVLLVALAGASARSLDEMPVAALNDAQAVRSGMQGAALSMDAGLLVDIVRARSRRDTSIRRLQLRGAEDRAVLDAELKRVLTRDRGAALLGLAITVLGLLPLVAGGWDGYLPSTLLLMVGMAFVLGGLRRTATSPGLRRMFPMGDRRLRFLFAAPGLLLALLWTVAVLGLGLLPSISFAAPGVVACVWLGLAAAVRWTAVGAPDFSTGLVVTEMGVVPVGALLSGVRGWDVALVGGLGLAIGGAPGLLVCLGCVLFGLLRA